MYDWEITQILQQNQYNIDSETYLRICSSSPQLNHIKYNAYEQCYEMWSKEGNYFRFTVYYKEKIK